MSSMNNIPVDDAVSQEDDNENALLAPYAYLCRAPGKHIRSKLALVCCYRIGVWVLLFYVVLFRFCAC
jgi:hypothetical protein